MDGLDDYLTASSGQDQDFCNPDNVEASLEYVNHRLTSFGISKRLALTGLPADLASDLLNAMQYLLQQKQEDTTVKRELDERYQKLYNEAELLRSRASTLATRLADSERLADSLKASLGLRENELRVLQKENKEMKRDLSVKADALASHQLQRATEIRRQTRESDKMREQVAKAGRGARGATLATLNAVQSSRVGLPGAKPTSAQIEEDVTRRIVTKYEEREAENIKENDSLRQMLTKYYLQLEDMLGIASASVAALEQGGEAMVTQPGGSLAAALSQLPLDLVRPALETRWIALLSQTERVVRGKFTSSVTSPVEESFMSSMAGSGESGAMMNEEKIELQTRIRLLEEERQDWLTEKEILKLDVDTAQEEKVGIALERDALQRQLAESKLNLTAHEKAVSRLRDQVQMSPGDLAQEVNRLRSQVAEQREIIRQYEMASIESMESLERSDVQMTSLQLKALEEELQKKEERLAAWESELQRREEDLNAAPKRDMANAVAKSEKLAAELSPWMLETPARIFGGGRQPQAETPGLTGGHSVKPLVDAPEDEF